MINNSNLLNIEDIYKQYGKRTSKILHLQYPSYNNGFFSMWNICPYMSEVYGNRPNPVCKTLMDCIEKYLFLEGQRKIYVYKI